MRGLSLQNGKGTERFNHIEVFLSRLSCMMMD